MEKLDFEENASRLSAREYVCLETANGESGLLLSGQEVRRAMRKYRQWRSGQFKAQVLFHSHIKDVSRLLQRWAKRIRV